jgi:hypothetical protein
MRLNQSKMVVSTKHLIERPSPTVISLIHVIGQFGNILENTLFPVFRETIGPLDSKKEQLIKTFVLLGLEGFIDSRRGSVGRPRHDRVSIARAFVAKAIYNMPHTRSLIDRLKNDAVLRRLCGWESTGKVPAECAFSRAFAEFARNGFPQRVHEALIEKTQKDRVIGHISRDSTAIEVREKAQPKPKKEAKPKLPRRKPGEPKRPEQMKRLERQTSMSQEEMLADLPKDCDVGTKTNSKGSKQSWVGYKLHVDAADGQIPISVLLTSASLHDSQVALPLATITASRVANFYDLMDGAYDSTIVRDESRKLGHVPIIEPVKHAGKLVPLAPHEVVRFRERTTVERVFARLKDEFGASSVRVRGNAKVMAHLMFGVLVLTVDQILRLAM